MYTHMYVQFQLHCKNRIVKITNLLVSTVTRNSGNCNLIGCVGCQYGDIHVIIIQLYYTINNSISLSCLIRYTKKQNNILIKSF